MGANLHCLLKNSFFQADQKCPDARRPKSWGVRRTWMYAATTKDEGNAADGRFSTACSLLISRIRICWTSVADRWATSKGDWGIGWSMIEMLKIYSKGFLGKCNNWRIDPLAFLSTTRNVFDFWNNLVLNYSWEPVPIGQRFLGSLRLWKVIRHEKCQFSPTSLGADFINSTFPAFRRQAQSAFYISIQQPFYRWHSLINIILQHPGAHSSRGW